MTTTGEARDLILARFRTAWLASVTTQTILLEWDDVADDRVKHDSNGRPLPWARVTVKHLTGGQATLGGPGIAKDEKIGLLRVEIFIPPGRGRTLGDQISTVVERAFRGKADGDLWYYDVSPIEEGKSGAWTKSRVDVSFRYMETT